MPPGGAFDSAPVAAVAAHADARARAAAHNADADAFCGGHGRREPVGDAVAAGATADAVAAPPSEPCQGGRPLAKGDGGGIAGGIGFPSAGGAPSALAGPKGALRRQPRCPRELSGQGRVRGWRPHASEICMFASPPDASWQRSGR